MYLFQISNYDDPAVDRETAELLHRHLEAESRRRCPAMWNAIDRIRTHAAKCPARKADGALPHLWRVPAGAGPFDADSRLDAAKNHRCDHCGRSRDYCRPAGVCPCSRKNAAAHTGILQKGGAESAELRRAVDWEKLKTAIRFEDAGITICAEENEEHLS